MFDCGNIQARPSVNLYEVNKKKNIFISLYSTFDFALSSARIRPVVVPIASTIDTIYNDASLKSAQIRSVIQSVGSFSISTANNDYALKSAAITSVIHSIGSFTAGSINFDYSIKSADITTRVHSLGTYPQSISFDYALKSASIS